MPDKGTRNAIFTLRMLSERSIQHQQNICFIDYKKAFDRVRHKRFFKILKDVGLDEKDQRIIYNLYHLQKGAIKLPNGLTEWTEINRGVCQRCVMSPDFFNLYCEHILRRLEESNDGVTINGVCINNIRYADDTALLIQKAFKGSWTSFWTLLLTKDWRSTARRPFAWWSRRKGSLQRATLYAMELV